MINPYERILEAVKWLKDRGQKVDLDFLIVLDEHDLTSEDKLRIAEGIKSKKIVSREIKQSGDYTIERSTMWGTIYDAIFGYLNAPGRGFTSFRDSMVNAISAAYLETSQIAWQDGGAELPLDEDAIDYGRLEIQSQLSFVDQLFINLREMKKENDFDPIAEAFTRANGYSQSLDIFYNNIKLRAAGNKMLTFGGPSGKESCTDCKKYMGQRHRASWWISRNAVPPSREFECHGYHCEHELMDDNGNVWTI